ncbi:MAG: type II toxin-antitoxin system prevent-host-death family antitoxin [Limnochordia bacterium]
MKSTITATELKQNLGKYLDYVAENNEIVVTKNGHKYVRLSPYITDHERYFLLKEKAADYSMGGARVSYEEFMEIYSKSELRLEFINGEIIIRGSPSLNHQRISGELYVLLRDFLRGGPCEVFYAPFDVHCRKEGFKDPDVVQPDLLVVCDLDENDEDTWYQGIPTLVVEILSPSTKSRDMVDKLQVYMLSGIGEYWIVDPENKLFLVYTFSDEQIATFDTYHLGDSFESSRLGNALVKVSAVFHYID